MFSVMSRVGRTRKSSPLQYIGNLKGKDRGGILCLRPLPSYHPEALVERGRVGRRKSKEGHEALGTYRVSA